MVERADTLVDLLSRRTRPVALPRRARSVSTFTTTLGPEPISISPGDQGSGIFPVTVAMSPGFSSILWTPRIATSG